MLGAIPVFIDAALLISFLDLLAHLIRDRRGSFVAVPILTVRQAGSVFHNLPHDEPQLGNAVNFKTMTDGRFDLLNLFTIKIEIEGVAVIHEVTNHVANRIVEPEIR
ncbi:hypothetical protein D3C77_599910 [compost metagenome]